MASARFWILGLGLALVAISVAMFAKAGGAFDGPTVVQLSLLVLQIGVGILVVEGIIGSALTSDNRKKADFSLKQLSQIAGSFRARALILVSEAGDRGETSGTVLVNGSFAETFVAGSFHPEPLETFQRWMTERFSKASDEFRHLTHFLDITEIESLQTPLERARLAFDSIPPLQTSTDSGRWTALMFALDQIQRSFVDEVKALQALGYRSEKAVLESVGLVQGTAKE